MKVIRWRNLVATKSLPSERRVTNVRRGFQDFSTAHPDENCVYFCYHKTSDSVKIKGKWRRIIVVSIGTKEQLRNSIKDRDIPREDIVGGLCCNVRALELIIVDRYTVEKAKSSSSSSKPIFQSYNFLTDKNSVAIVGQTLSTVESSQSRYIVWNSVEISGIGFSCIDDFVSTGILAYKEKGFLSPVSVPVNRITQQLQLMGKFGVKNDWHQSRNDNVVLGIEVAEEGNDLSDIVAFDPYTTQSARDRAFQLSEACKNPSLVKNTAFVSNVQISLMTEGAKCYVAYGKAKTSYPRAESQGGTKIQVGKNGKGEDVVYLPEYPTNGREGGVLLLLKQEPKSERVADILKVLVSDLPSHITIVPDSVFSLSVHALTESYLSNNGAWYGSPCPGQPKAAVQLSVDGAGQGRRCLWQVRLPAPIDEWVCVGAMFWILFAFGKAPAHPHTEACLEFNISAFGEFTTLHDQGVANAAAKHAAQGRDAPALHLDWLTPADSASLAMSLQEKCNPAGAAKHAAQGRDAPALHLDWLTPADSASLAMSLQQKCNPAAEQRHADLAENVAGGQAEKAFDQIQAIFSNSLSKRRGRGSGGDLEGP